MQTCMRKSKMKIILHRFHLLHVYGVRVRVSHSLKSNCTVPQVTMSAQRSEIEEEKKNRKENGMKLMAYVYHVT